MGCRILIIESGHGGFEENFFNLQEAGILKSTPVNFK
jgi:hypothetical protein